MVLAVLHQEAGWERALAEPPGIISTVNLSEVAAKLADAGMPEAALREALGHLGLEPLPLEEEHALRAGLLRPVTRHLGLSLGDRCCLALAQALDLPVLTNERLWLELDLGLDIRLMR